MINQSKFYFKTFLCASAAILHCTTYAQAGNSQMCQADFKDSIKECNASFNSAVDEARKLSPTLKDEAILAATEIMQLCKIESRSNRDSCNSGVEITFDYLEEYNFLSGDLQVEILPADLAGNPSFSILPNLPDGLVFDSTNGSITGQLLEGTDFFAAYTVTGTDGSSQTSDVFDLNFSSTSIAEIDIHPATDSVILLEGVDPATLNPFEPTLIYTIENALFEDPYVESSLTVNGVEVVSPDNITDTQIQFRPILQDGQNILRFKSYDSDGRPLFKETVVYAGNNTLTANVLNEDGSPATESVEIKLSLTDDSSVGTTVIVEGGIAVFENLPSRTILLEAKSATNKFGAAGDLGFVGTINIVLSDLIEISDIDNNDISQGLAGWETDSTSVFVVLHDETQGPDTETQSLKVQNVYDGESVPDRQSIHETMLISIDRAADDAITAQQESEETNDDIRLMTSGEGPQRLSRRFSLKPETNKVKVRYRFITTEVPGGYFGTEFNDYYSVAIFAASGAANATDTSSMNSLGLSAFDQSSGATQWQTLEIKVEPNTNESVQLDVTVANVADGILDSSVEIDFIEEVATSVTPTLEWNSANGGLDLLYEVVGQDPTDMDIPIQLFWADGTSETNQQGAAFNTFTVPEGTAPGNYGPEHIIGNFLNDAPDGISHLIANADSTLGTLEDVTVNYRANADAGVVAADLEEIIQDGGRQAGDPVIDISSTARTATDQARAMFGNLVRGFPNATQPTLVQDNIDEQLGEYLAPGRAVVRAYETAVQGLSQQQILTNAANLRQTMVAEINNQGCDRVSRHCADPATQSVVDVPLSSITDSGEQRFRDTVAAQVDTLLDENNVYHLQLDIP